MVDNFFRPLTLWDYIKHWLGRKCGMRIVRTEKGVEVEYLCRVCAKRDVMPEVWEERRNQTEKGI